MNKHCTSATLVEYFTMRFGLNILGLAASASAHTLFTTFFVNGENQGDGTCVRMPQDPETATAPIYPLDGDVMACGKPLLSTLSSCHSTRY